MNPARTEDGELIVVIAGNSRQFHDWCKENELNPRSVIYATGAPGRLRGISGPIKVVHVGTWMDRDDIDEINYALNIIQSRTR